MIFRLLAAACAMTGSIAHAAGGLTSIAIPTQVEIIQSQGFVIHGAFGNPGPTLCGLQDKILVAVTHPQYHVLFSLATTAMTTGKKIQAYVHVCTTVGWYGYAMNELTSDGTLSILP